MRKKLCIRQIFAVAILLFLFSCRNEDFANNLTESKREEEFFRANLKTLSEEQKQILTYLQNENSKNNFVGSLKDKVGLPIWNNTSSTSQVGLINALNKSSESDTITVAIPLTQDKEYLSSLLTAKVVNGNVIQVSNIDNLDLYNYINNSSVSTSKRETALLNFIYADHKAFGTKQYINIPADLFPEIELRDGESKKRMNVVSISEEEEEEEGTSNFVAPIRICVTREVICGHCSGTVILGYHTECFTYIGEYTSGGSGGDGGAGNTGGGNEGGGGGSGSGSSDCGNRGVFYRIEPEGCGGNDLPPAVQILKDNMWDNFNIDISEYEYYLSENISVTNKFNVYLTQNNNQNGASFVNWGLGFLSQNPDISWMQFENWFINESLPSNIMTEFLADLYNPDIVKPTKRLKNNLRVNCIFNKIKTASNFKQYLQNFDGRFSTAHLSIDLKPLANSEANAETSPPNAYWINIVINSNNLNRPTLDIARTFMHEIIHAEMFRILLSLAPTSNGMINVAELKNMLNSHNYPGIYDYYRRFGLNNLQHEQMAAHYRGIIKNFLKQVDNSITDSQAEAMAWVGLQGTVAWSNLGTVNQNNILATYDSWKSSATHNCP